MLDYLFFWTRLHLANFPLDWPLSVMAVLLMLFLRLVLLRDRPCKGLMLGMPIAYVVVSVIGAWLISLDKIELISLMCQLGYLEVALFFAWLGLLLGTAIEKLLAIRKEERSNE